MRIRDPFVPTFLLLLFVTLAIVTVDAQAYYFGEINGCYAEIKFEGRIDSEFDKRLKAANRSTSEDIFNTKRTNCVGGIFGGGVVKGNNLFEGWLTFAPNMQMESVNEFGSVQARIDTIAAGVSAGRLFFNKRLAIKTGAGVHKTRAKVHMWLHDGNGGLDEIHKEFSDVTYGLQAGAEYKVTPSVSVSYTYLSEVGDPNSIGRKPRHLLGLRTSF